MNVLYSEKSPSGLHGPAARSVLAAVILVTIGWAGTPLKVEAQENLPSWASPSSQERYSSTRADSRTRERPRSARRITQGSDHSTGVSNSESFGGGVITYAPTQECTPGSCPSGQYCATIGNSGGTECRGNGTGPGNENGTQGPADAPISGLLWLLTAGLRRWVSSPSRSRSMKR